IAGASRSDTTQGKLNGLPPDLTEGYVKSLGEIHAECKAHGVPLLVSTFLVKYRRDQERPVQLANADVAFYYMPWMSIDDLLDGIDAYNGAIVKYAKDHDVPLAAETTSIPADGRHFVDCVHFADDGCAKMADRMLDAME